MGRYICWVDVASKVGNATISNIAIVRTSKGRQSWQPGKIELDPDVLGYGCTCVPVYRYTSVLVYMCTSAPMYRCTVYLCTGEPVYQSTLVDVYYHNDVPMHQCMHRCTGVP